MELRDGKLGRVVIRYQEMIMTMKRIFLGLTLAVCSSGVGVQA